MFVLAEPLLEEARPDLLVVVASAQGVRSLLRQGRIATSPTVARILLSEPHPSSRSYETTVLREHGRGSRLRLAKRAMLIATAVGIEVKVRDGRRALQQVARFRNHVDEAVVAMPETAADRLPQLPIENYGVGVIGLRGETAKWLRLPGHRPTSGASRAWIAELMVKAFESNELYTFSRSRKMLTAFEMA